MSANELELLWAVLAMVLLTVAVWLRLYFERLTEMKTRRIHPQKVATRALAADALQDTRAADHFKNLFEVPVLFYLAVVLTLVTHSANSVIVIAAWVFVACRIVHALIHTTYNKVMHRFGIYVAGCAALWTMWVLLAVRWIGASPV